jgi:pyrroline-5-carboxylate reductase
VILAVNPQYFNTLAQAIKSFLKDTQIIFSVMAGITIATLEKQLTRTKILCSMPNIPTQIGMGIIVFTASATEDRKELFIIQNLIKIPVENQFI